LGLLLRVFCVCGRDFRFLWLAAGLADPCFNERVILEKNSLKYGAVVAAAGLSSRMGDYKPMMELGGRTMALRVLGAFCAAGVSRVVFVTGYRADELEAHIAGAFAHSDGGFGFDDNPASAAASADIGAEGQRGASGAPALVFLRNEAFAITHMFDSAVIGFRDVLDKCDMTFFCPVDVPLFTADTLGRLMRAAGDGRLGSAGSGVFIPCCGGRAGHPVLIDNALLPAIIEYSGEGGLKSAFEACGAAEFVDVDDGGVLYDADTPDDFARLAARLDGEGS
jgi:CTP:molybdopterin cytidylyltransferase MocA